MKKLLLTLFTAVLALSGCNNEEFTTIELGVMPSMSAAPFIYASETGIYEQYGLDVNVQVFNSTPDLNAALKGGQLTAINNDFPSAILMYEDGDDIAISMATNDIFTLVASPQSAYSKIEDVSAGTLGLMEVSVTEYISTLVADQYQIDFDLVHIPKLGDRFTAVMAGEIDMAMLCEPFAGLAAVDGGNTLWANNDGPFLTTLSWDRSFIDQYPEQYSDFHKATDQAVSEITDGGFDSYKQYLIDYQILTDDNVDLVEEQAFSPVQPADMQAFEEVVTWMLEKELISDEVKYEQLFVDWR